MQVPGKKPELTILLPTLNEETAIRQVLDEIQSLPIDSQVIVIDGRSTDRTVEIAREMGATIHYEDEKGKGVAVRSALGLIDTPYTIMVNADYTYPIHPVIYMHKLMSEEGIEVVVGYRHIRQKGSMSTLNTIGNNLLSLEASILYGRRIYDVCSGLWGFHTEILQSFNLTSMGFTLEADLFINSMGYKCTKEQIPIPYRSRPEGSSSKLKFSHGLEIGLFLVKGLWKN